MEIAAWLERFFPRIEPIPWGDPCWLAMTKTRSPEHNPPLYWLGRALDAVDEGGDAEAMGARLLAAHGAEACDGWSEQDQRVQDVLTEACAYAWAASHLGAPSFEPSEADGTMLIHVPARDAFVAPHRLWPVRTMDDLLRNVARDTSATAEATPPAAGRIVYFDVYLNPRMYAQDIGYHTDLTEPLRAAVKHFATERNLGYVLTRPFQWGNPIAAHY